MPFKKGNKEAKKKGKHKKTIEQEKALEFLREAIRDNLPELIQNKLELAKGIWVEKVVVLKDSKGKVTRTNARVYRVAPDSDAIEDLFDRVVGKPKQLVDLGGEFPMSVVINLTSEEVAKAEKRIAAKKNAQ